MKTHYVIVFVAALLLGTAFACQKEKETPENQYNPKIDSLLSQMTLEEKIGQMTQICFSTITMDENKKLDLNAQQFKEAILDYHVGSFLSGSDSKNKWATFVKDIQQIAVDSTRLGIPLIIGIDHVHGSNYVDEGTIFPHNLSISCSFDTSLVKKAARITATETAPLGLSWNFSPVLDVGKNPYWPRLYETFGEDPLLCAAMGKSFINGYQNCQQAQPHKLAACAKHFVGYSDPESGWDRTPAYIPDQILHEHFIPPFQAAIDANVKTVMVNSGEVNGIPVHASKKLLTGLLRKRMEFDGVILTDIKDISKIVDMHSGARNLKEATKMALDAGIDMSMACTSFKFCKIVKELVQEGKITEERINESVRRILQLKYDLNLFKHPYPQEERLDRIGSKEHSEAAREAAEKSIVLLKNRNRFLPLDTAHTNILLTGFAADSKKMLNGAWTFEWMGAKEERQPDHMKTIREALIADFGKEQVEYFNEQYLERDTLPKSFQSRADSSDAIIVTIGERPYSEFKGNITNLALKQNQQEWVRKAYQTGKPVILLLIEGRPRVITEIEKQASGVLFAGYPGMKGAEAISAILSGEVAPTGKLSFTYPSDVAHCVPYYHKPSDSYTALYPFGHGLTYGGFEYSNLKLSDTTFTSPDQEITATVNIKNTGDSANEETVLWFIRDVTGTITRPVKQLKQFYQISLPAGIEKEYKWTFTPREVFAYPDQNGEMKLEKGEFKIMIDALQTTLIYQ